MTKAVISAELRDSYDRFYANHDRQWRHMGAVAKADNIVRLCSSVRRDKVIEVGCGDGAVLQELSRRGFAREYFAVDVSGVALEAVRRLSLPALRECTTFDGYTIPHGDGSFDLAILTHVLEHVEHPRVLLKELARVAAHVLIEVPLEDNRRLPENFTLDEVGHINFYSPRTIRFLLQSAGFEVVAQRTANPSREIHVLQHGRIGAVNYLVKQLALRLLPRTATRLFTYHGTLLCRPVERRVSDPPDQA